MLATANKIPLCYFVLRIQFYHYAVVPPPPIRHQVWGICMSRYFNSPTISEYLVPRWYSLPSSGAEYLPSQAPSDVLLLGRRESMLRSFGSPSREIAFLLCGCIRSSYRTKLLCCCVSYIAKNHTHLLEGSHLGVLFPAVRQDYQNQSLFMLGSLVLIA